MTCINQSNLTFSAIEPLNLPKYSRRSNEQKLTCIHIEIAQLVGGVVMSNLRTDKGSNVIQKSVSFDLHIM